MGIIPVKPPFWCNSCQICFPPNLTPGGLKIFFSGMTAAQFSPPNSACPWNGYYDVPVNGDLTCFYDTGVGSDPRVKVRLAAPHTLVQMSSVAEGMIFQSWDMPPCTFWLENKLVYLNHFWWKGQVWIGDALELARIIESVTPMIDPNPRMECFPMEDEHIAVRYAGKRDATNISIMFDTNP